MIFAQMPVLSFLSVRGGLRYVVLGGRVDYETKIVQRGPDGDPISMPPEQFVGRLDFTHGYATVRVQTVVHPTALPVAVLVGPEIGYLMSADLENHQVMPTEFSEKRDIVDGMDRVNVAGTIGISRTKRLAGSALHFALVYSHGISGVADDDDWFSDWSTREFGLTFGIVF